ncbi:hypothetical protein [Rhodococcus ruber]|uniref:hypothetical protein n=1 Tax=Rhodococcus ruber TaxID=1830 RepID=UPI001F18FA69|nr:hypothetical protein [Rhodococcus ruber]MCF8785249.1 hypothetical protein [Rhodococcus ruber]
MFSKALSNLSRKEISAISSQYPKSSTCKDKVNWVKANTQAAGLLQDVGELPIENATRDIIVPNSELRTFVFQWLDLPLSTDISPKLTFTLAILREYDRSNLLEYLDFEFIAALLCRSVPVIDILEPVILPLRNLLDSQIDADRIDYIFRDSLLTIGSIGNPLLVIESISQYETDTILVSNPAHVGAALMARNHLYRSVYLDTRRRLMEQSLRNVIAYYHANKEDLAPASSDSDFPTGEIGINQLKRIDDSSVDHLIAALMPLITNGSLPDSVARALSTLSQDPAATFDSVWVSHTTETAPLSISGFPNSILADNQGDYSRANAELNGKVLVGGEHFSATDGTAQPITEWIPELAAGQPSSTPPILAFIPRDLDTRSRRIVEEAQTTGALYYHLHRLIREQNLIYEPDTRMTSGFTGNPIHISWTWADLEIVREIISELYRRRRRYYLLLEPFDGFGSSTRENSRQLILTAPSLLFLVSGAYLQRRADLPNGNIAAELTATHELKIQGKLPPTSVLALDDWKSVHDNFPWDYIGRYNNPPFTGLPARNCSRDELRSLVGSAIEVLDGAAHLEAK